jgi:hypothetical protein
MTSQPERQTTGGLPGGTGGRNPASPTQPQPPGIGAAEGAGRPTTYLEASQDHVHDATFSYEAVGTSENARSLRMVCQSAAVISIGTKTVVPVMFIAADTPAGFRRSRRKGQRVFACSWPSISVRSPNGLIEKGIFHDSGQILVSLPWISGAVSTMNGVVKAWSKLLYSNPRSPGRMYLWALVLRPAIALSETVATAQRLAFIPSSMLYRFFEAKVNSFMLALSDGPTEGRQRSPSRQCTAKLEPRHSRPPMNLWNDRDSTLVD